MKFNSEIIKTKYFDEEVKSDYINYTKVLECFDSETGKVCCIVENVVAGFSTAKIGRRQVSLSLADYEEIIMENGDAEEIRMLNYEVVKADVINELRINIGLSA